MVPGIFQCPTSKEKQRSEKADYRVDLPPKQMIQQSRTKHQVPSNISQCINCSFDVQSHNTVIPQQVQWGTDEEGLHYNA